MEESRRLTNNNIMSNLDVRAPVFFIFLYGIEFWNNFSRDDNQSMHIKSGIGERSQRCIAKGTKASKWRLSIICLDTSGLSITLKRLLSTTWRNSSYWIK